MNIKKELVDEDEDVGEGRIMTMDIRIPYRSHKKDMAYILFHNDDT
ncbi:hypothetical protein [Neobacillus drentensis]